MRHNPVDLSALRDYLDDTMGVPEGPYQLATRMVDLSRQTGRTTELIRALPTDGNAYVIVHSQAYARCLEQLLRDRYHQHIADPMIKNLVFITYSDFKKNPRKYVLRGRRPAFVDNCIFDMETQKLVTEINDILNPPKPKKTMFPYELTHEESEVLEAFRNGDFVLEDAYDEGDGDGGIEINVDVDIDHDGWLTVEVNGY